jgi:tyrosyl-tRNA synthetase
MTDTNVFDVLKERGYVYQCTHPEEVRRRLGEGPVTFYLGIDPTADSLHIGHFFALMMFRYLQDAGHKGILLIGGATAMVGDPSGKSDMRKMMSHEQIEHNVSGVRELAKKFVRTDGENPAIILSNDEWFRNIDYVGFMREVGTHFNVNKMLAAEAYRSRLETGGLTFLEMGYMLMQAYDFIYLNRTYGCTLQIGGSDQWGNITAGCELNRKMNFISDDDNADDRDIFGLTNPLLLTKDGKKMGKTEHGALWVAGDRTTPYDFYQYFYNVDDQDVDSLLRLFTRVPLDEINTLCATDILKAKRLMAYEITKLVHGAAEADKVIEAVDALFKSGGADSANAPTYEIGADRLGITLIDLMAESGFIASKSEARRLIQQGGVSVNGEKCTDIAKLITAEDLTDGTVLLKRGKRNFLKVVFG